MVSALTDITRYLSCVTFPPADSFSMRILLISRLYRFSPSFCGLYRMFSNDFLLSAEWLWMMTWNRTSGGNVFRRFPYALKTATCSSSGAILKLTSSSR